MFVYTPLHMYTRDWCPLPKISPVSTYPLYWYRIRDEAATKVGTQKLASYRSAGEVGTCSVVEHLLGLVGTSNCDFPWGTDGGREERELGRREEGNNLQPTCIFESRKLAFQILRTLSKEYHIYQHCMHTYRAESLSSSCTCKTHQQLPKKEIQMN